MIELLKNPGTRVITRMMEKCGGKKQLQIALNKMGKHLVVDGDLGPITIRAIKSVNNKILHQTLEKVMFGVETKKSKVKKVKSKAPSWVVYAYNELGTREIHGDRDNPRVLQYHSAAGGSGWKDEVPWCASFIAFIMIKAGYKVPYHPAAALSWLKFGRSVYRPVLGAIAVKHRPGSGKGHVTIVVGKSRDGKYVYCLGGNQNDEVNIKRYPVSVFSDFRVPHDYKDVYSLKIMTGRGGAVREA